jgi:hypothetical protein
VVRVRLGPDERLGLERVGDLLHGLTTDTESAGRRRGGPVSFREHAEDLPAGLRLAGERGDLITDSSEGARALVHVSDEQRERLRRARGRHDAIVVDKTLSTLHRGRMKPIDLYTLPHKALRTAVNHAGTLLSATDPTRLVHDLDVVEEVLAELRAHAHHEEAFIHPLLARFAPDVLAALDAQHTGLELALAALERAVEDLVRNPDVPPEALLALHRSFQRFTAHHLVHLDHEETVAMPALWTTAPAAELDDVMARFRAAHPEAVRLYQRWSDGLAAHERRFVGLG